MKKKSTQFLLLLIVLISITVHSNAQTVPAYIPSNGLVAWYPFNGNANDESGNGNNGTVNGATLTTDRNGNANSAYSFDGTSYIDIPPSATLNPSEITVSTWVKYTTQTSGYKCIFSNWKDDGVNDRTYNMAISPSDNFHSTVSPNGTPTATLCNSITTVTLNVWKHFLVTYNDTTLNVYIDGVLDNSVAATTIGPINTSANNLLRIGAKNVSTPTEFIVGDIDDIGIWNRALTQQEITALYLSNTNTTSCLPNYVPTNGLVGWWPFCGNASDESGNGNNGTVNGASLTTDRNGNANSAYSFDGISSSINIQNSASLQFNGGLTISAWLNASSSPGPVSYWFSKGSDGGTPYSWISNLIGSNKIMNIGIYDNANNYSGVGSNTALQLNTWINFVVTYDGVNAKAYVNGILENSTPCSYTTFANAYDLVIGRRYNSGAPYFWDGKIDDFGIWNRALTQQEITTLFNGCQLSIVSQPSNVTTNLATNTQFIVHASDTNATYQWQTDIGSGFVNLTNAGQFSGVQNDTLTISNILAANNNQAFHCIVTLGVCTDTTNAATLQVGNLGVNDQLNNPKIVVFPNPIKDVFQLKIDSQFIGDQFEILDYTGKAILSGIMQSENNSVNLQQLRAGLYLLKIEGKSHQIIKIEKL